MGFRTGFLAVVATGAYRFVDQQHVRRFANALLAAVESEELRKIAVRMGGIDQFIDCTDYIENPKTYQGTKRVYR